jgi:glycosyltransferase involved in cell wall biosynthesis
MRIAVIVRSLKIGGMERVAISLNKAFQDEGHDSHLIYFKKKKEHFDTKNIKNLHHFDFDRTILLSIVGIFYEIFIRILNIFFRRSYAISKGFLTSFLFKKKLAELEKESGEFELIIIRGQGTFEFLWHNQDKRYIQVCENLLYPEEEMTFFTSLHAKILYADKNIVCVSNGVLDSFKDISTKAKFNANKALVITNPINIDEIQELSTLYTPEITTPYIVNIGRLSPIKQLPLLIEAYDHMIKTYNLSYKLVLVGIGHDEENIKNKIKSLNLEDSVILTGAKTNPFPWMAHAKLFVLSSRYEGLGMVLLEALACNTPLLATRSQGGVSDVMKGELEELLCEPDAKSLSEAMAKQLNNPKKIDYSRYLKPFLASTIVNKYIDNFYSK